MDNTKVNRNINTTKMKLVSYPKGSLMFIEGETSTDMFIIRSGKVRILKQQGERVTELAVLGPGSVLGELSLLDNQPRSATAQVIEDLTAIVITESMFKKTVDAMPSWFGNILFLIVKRLRDTLKKISDRIVSESISGVIRILLILYKKEYKEIGNEKVVDLDILKKNVADITGLGELDTEKALLHLILKNMILIKKENFDKEYVNILDPEVIELYMRYLRYKIIGGKFPGEDLSQNAIELVRLILSCAEKNGKLIKESVYSITVMQLEIEVQRVKKQKHIDPEALGELVDKKIIIKNSSSVKTGHQSHNYDVLVFNKKTLENIQTLFVWLDVFKEEVIF